MNVTNREMLDWLERAKIWTAEHIFDGANEWQSLLIDDVEPIIEQPQNP